MKRLDITELNNLNINNSIVAIGFFDGVHLGHQKIINTLVNISKKENAKSVVITFDDSLLSLFKMANPILSFAQREDALEKLGVDYCIIISKDNKGYQLTAKEFISNNLMKINCSQIICGSDFSIGSDGQKASYLIDNSNIEVINVDDVYDNDIKISSTYIRNLLINGLIEKANKYLYSDFELIGKVIPGKQIGRQINFKTANIEPPVNASPLKRGVYNGVVFVKEKKYKAMINVGFNPTVNEVNSLHIEAYILDFSDDIYNENIVIVLKEYTREEIKFSSINELHNQLEKDYKCLIESKKCKL